jgi:hypothetical protein
MKRIVISVFLTSELGTFQGHAGAAVAYGSLLVKGL